MRHPCTPTIPHDGLVAANKMCGVKNKNPNAAADTNPGDGTGSAWFRVNAWCMQWGQQRYCHAVMNSPSIHRHPGPTLNSWFPHSSESINLASVSFLCTVENPSSQLSYQHTFPMRVSPCQHWHTCSNWKNKFQRLVCVTENKACWPYLQYILVVMRVSPCQHWHTCSNWKNKFQRLVCVTENKACWPYLQYILVEIHNSMWDENKHVAKREFAS